MGWISLWYFPSESESSELIPSGGAILSGNISDYQLNGNLIMNNILLTGSISEIYVEEGDTITTGSFPSFTGNLLSISLNGSIIIES
jgi:hypothetical protein